MMRRGEGGSGGDNVYTSSRRDWRRKANGCAYQKPSNGIHVYIDKLNLGCPPDQYSISV